MFLHCKKIGPDSVQLTDQDFLETQTKIWQWRHLRVTDVSAAGWRCCWPTRWAKWWTCNRNRRIQGADRAAVCRSGMRVGAHRCSQTGQREGERTSRRYLGPTDLQQENKEKGTVDSFSRPLLQVTHTTHHWDYYHIGQLCYYLGTRLIKECGLTCQKVSLALVLKQYQLMLVF